MAESKRIVDLNGVELRQRARDGRRTGAAEARAELERRRGNLRGAVIPEWEKAERGPDVSEWDVVR